MTDFEDFLDDDPDRRRIDRLFFNHTFEIRSDTIDESIFVLGEDISIGGIKFFCEKEALYQFLTDEEQQMIQKESQLVASDPITIILNSDLHLRAAIRSVSEVEADKSGWDAAKNIPVSREQRESYLVNIEFINLDEPQKNKLTEYIKNLS